MLRYFDTSLDKLDWKDMQQKLQLNDYGDFFYKLKKYDDRIYHTFTLFFKNNQARKDNIETIVFYVSWRDLRPLPAGNEGTGFYLSGGRESCTYFKYSFGKLKQEIKNIRENNAKQ